MILKLKYRHLKGLIARIQIDPSSLAFIVNISHHWHMLSTTSHRNFFFTITLSVVLFNLYCHFGKWFWVCHFFHFGLIVVNLMAYHFRDPNNTIKQFTVVKCGWAKILLYYNMLIHGLSSTLFFFSLSPSWIWHKIQKDSCKRDSNCK